MHSSIYKHENQINLNKRPVQKNRCKGRLFILIEQLNYLEAYSGSLETPKHPLYSGVRHVILDCKYQKCVPNILVRIFRQLYRSNYFDTNHINHNYDYFPCGFIKINPQQKPTHPLILQNFNTWAMTKNMYRYFTKFQEDFFPFLSFFFVLSPICFSHTGVKMSKIRFLREVFKNGEKQKF